MNIKEIDRALELLAERLALKGGKTTRLVVCGGSALISAHIISRETTKDVDIIALINGEGHVVSPDPLPLDLLEEAQRVARDLDLPNSWLNNGPSRDPGGLFQLGLPEGFQERLVRRDYGVGLSVYFAGRLDQICFKVYAAVDQGFGKHVDDIKELKPTTEEMLTAAQWAMTHDTSDGFKKVLKSMLEQIGYDSVSSRIQ
jgi:hypothetical protein